MTGPPNAAGAAFRRPASFAVLAGILLAIAATWPTAGTPGAPGRLLFLYLPQWLGVCVVIALAGVAVPLFAAMLPAPRRRDPDDFELEPMPPPEGGKRAAFLLLALLLLAATGAGWLVTQVEWNSGAVTAAGASHALTEPNSPPPPPVSAAPPRTLHIPLADHALTLVIALTSVAALAAAIWIFSENSWYFPNHAGRRRRRHLAQAMAEAVVAGLADLTDDPDPRRAVIACYRRCEAAVAAARRHRYPWQTPREFVETALVALSLPRTAVRSLLSVFERARFSNEPVDAADRRTALAALDDIRTALAEGKEHGTRH